MCLFWFKNTKNGCDSAIALLTLHLQCQSRPNRYWLFLEDSSPWDSSVGSSCELHVPNIWCSWRSQYLTRFPAVVGCITTASWQLPGQCSSPGLRAGWKMLLADLNLSTSSATEENIQILFLDLLLTRGEKRP